MMILSKANVFFRNSLMILAFLSLNFLCQGQNFGDNAFAIRDRLQASGAKVDTEYRNGEIVELITCTNNNVEFFSTMTVNGYCERYIMANENLAYTSYRFPNTTYEDLHDAFERTYAKYKSEDCYFTYKNQYFRIFKNANGATIAEHRNDKVAPAHILKIYEDNRRAEEEADKNAYGGKAGQTILSAALSTPGEALAQLGTALFGSAKKKEKPSSEKKTQAANENKDQLKPGETLPIALTPGLKFLFKKFDPLEKATTTYNVLLEKKENGTVFFKVNYRTGNDTEFYSDIRVAEVAIKNTSFSRTDFGGNTEFPGAVSNMTDELPEFIFSTKTYSDLISKGEFTLKTYKDDPGTVYQKKAIETIKLNINGKPKEVKCIFVENKREDYESKVAFWILDNPNCPLLVKQIWELGPDIQTPYVLTEITF
jgi:hypothetical protein